ncbi:hypothetical protein Scep_028394 [Stephania cephalantha]|uniref:PGG domain-containing protein n=1 Tax=Stephania cephalantha TaxID=152367 RepID=A0AAP0EEG6_9MAGN
MKKIAQYMDIDDILEELQEESSTPIPLMSPQPSGLAGGEQKKETMSTYSLETLGYQHRWNPLHHAAYHGITLNIEKSLKRNIKYASEQDESGQCPIHLAASQGHLYCIKVMIRELEDTIHQKNRDGQNVFHIAAKTGKKEIMKYLLRNLSPEFIRHVNDVDNEGNTVLHLAVKNWHHAIVYMLVGEKMTVLDAPNYEGFTPLDICEREMLSPPQFSQLVILKILKMAKAESGRKYVKTFGGQENNEKNYKRKLEYYRGWIDTSLIVATLILAVTFAAGFTIPGGYNSQGMAALLKKPTFCIFVFFNSLATYVSLLIIVILSRVVLTSDFDSLSTAVKVCTPLLGIAVFFLAVAFTAGVFSTMSNLTWFAYALLSVCMTLTILILFLVIVLHMLLSADFHIFFTFTYRVVVPLMLWLNRGDE